MPPTRGQRRSRVGLSLRARQPGRQPLFLAPALALATLAACRGDSPSEPSPVTASLTERLETADVVFHFTPGDSVDAEWQQAFHEWATARLSVSLPGKLHYYKYTSAAQARQLTGSSFRSWADPATYSVHTPDRHHGHEALHVYTYLIGWPPDYFLEGIAVGLNLDPLTAAGPFYPYPVGTDVHAQSCSALMLGQLIAIETIVENAGFWNWPESLTYPQAGSFVAFLAERHGIGRLKALTASIGHSASREASLATFQSIYGVSLGEVESRWRDSLCEPR